MSVSGSLSRRWRRTGSPHLLQSTYRQQAALDLQSNPKLARPRQPRKSHGSTQVTVPPQEPGGPGLLNWGAARNAEDTC